MAACITLALCRYATTLSAFARGEIGLVINVVISVIIWIATWHYATDCMVRTADGYADPPEVSLEDRIGSPHGILAIHAVVILACVIVTLFAHPALWLVLAVAAVLLPALDMSLAFDGSMVVALNPVTWFRIVARFGVAYLIPVLANVALAILVWMALQGTSKLPFVIALPLYGFACTYLVLLDFHWMGLLIWHYRERFGMRPEAPELARRMGQGADGELVREYEVLAQHDPEAAAIRLRDRIRERSAPASVHTLFRTLLRRLHRNDLLLQHGESWIAQLCADDQARRALGVVQECREIDSGFLPDDPDNAATLARLAARLGMHDLAAHLARGFVQRWPQHAAAAEIRDLIGDGPQPA